DSTPQFEDLQIGSLNIFLYICFQNNRVLVGDPKPTHFSLQSQLLCRHITSEISENQLNFTVTYLINTCGLSPEGAVLASKWVELQSPERADSVLELLRNYGASQTQISKLIRSHPKLLSTDPEKNLMPKLEFFSSLEISKVDLLKKLAFNPKLLAVSLRNRILPTYNFLRSMLSEKNVGFVFKLKSCIFLEGHCKHVVPNIGLLRESGMPQPCISFLLTRMIAKYPVALGLSLERRLIPRCSVVKVLLLKGFINENLNLGSLLKPTEKQFLEIFVNRYLGQVPELLSLYQGKVDIQDV
ncbi:unnamed protein product, partial [Prunus brigantina]